MREWLQKARKAKRLTQAGLAAMLEVHLGSVASWEQGVRSPTKPAQKLLSQILGVNACAEFEREAAEKMEIGVA